MSEERPTEHAGHDEEDGPRQRWTLTQRTYHSVIDQLVGQGQAEGAFDNLQGTGKPLQLDDESMVPEEDRVGYRMLRNAGFAPPWIELQKTIREKRAQLDTWRETKTRHWGRMSEWEQKRARIEYRDKLSELNRLIIHFNLKVPAAVGQMVLLKVDDEVARLGI